MSPENVWNFKWIYCQGSPCSFNRKGLINNCPDVVCVVTDARNRGMCSTNYGLMIVLIRTQKNVSTKSGKRSTYLGAFTCIIHTLSLSGGTFK